MADADPGAMAVPAVPAALARSAHDLNDLGNARRLCALAAGKLKFVDELGRQGEWVAFDGQRWSVRIGKATAVALAQRVVEALLEEARALHMASPDELAAAYHAKFDREAADERAVQLYGWAMKTGNSERTSGMLKQAQALELPGGGFAMRAALDDFDTDPLAWHCRNGTLRFVERDDGWRCRFDAGHRPEDMFMQMAAVDYDGAAECPAWRARLDLLHRDPVARDALQRLYGMTLTALTSDQAFYVFQGKGGDGKSMTNSIVGELQGDYFRSTSPQTFLEGRQRNAADHQSDIVRLRGDIRMVVTDEPKKGAVWNVERIKQVTGSLITARAPNAVEEITFKPHWKLFVECNPLPRAPSDDRGFRRRFKLFPWTVQFGITAGAEDRPEHVVRSELRAEAAGILNWMIEGALRWLDTQEIPEPELSRRAISSFWATGSVMGEWLAARCDTSDPDARTGATDLYNDFKAFCADAGIEPDKIVTQTTFGTALNEAQIYSDKDRAGRKVRIGIRLRAAGEAVATADDGAARPASPLVAGDEWEPI